jgi:phosphoribosylanthranilate isomerase
MRTRVKFCGMTRPDDALVAARVGADAIGLVFYAPSPRAVSLDVARAIVSVLPPFISVVGLFVNAAHETVSEVLDQVRIDVLQFHGDEPADDCQRYGRPYIKACRVGEGTDVEALAREHVGAAALLLDTYDPALVGGTGKTFDWERVPHRLPLPLILAGGLTPENVAEAIRAVRPYAVDVSGGIEAAKGIKDAQCMQRFMDAVASVAG